MGSEVLVIGLGSNHGDDAVGWDVVSRLNGVEARCVSDPSVLAELPKECQKLILVDACRGTGPPGTIHRFEWPNLPAEIGQPTSTHGWGLATGLQLADCLRRLPKRVVIFTVEAGPAEPGCPPTPEVAAAVSQLVELVRREIMNATPTPDELLATPLLAPLTDAEAARLAATAVRESFGAGAVIFRAGDPVRRFWIVESGRVAIEIYGPDRRARRLHTVEPGELLAWSPLIGSSAMTATGRAIEPATLIAFDAAAVLALCESDTAFGFRFMKNLAKAVAARLHSSRLQLLDAFHVELPTIPEGSGL
ncbi:MAG: hydrogenase maturation protease [Gemmataceae bacterium]